MDRVEDVDTAKNVLESLEKISGQKMITFTLLTKNIEYVQNIVRDLPGETKSLVEKVFVKLGLSLEIKKESEIRDKPKEEIVEDKSEQKYKILYANTSNEKKLESMNKKFDMIKVKNSNTLIYKLILNAN